MSKTVTRHVLDLPFPPSVNHYWRRNESQGFLDKRAQAFRDEVVILCNRRKTLTGRLLVEIHATPPDRRRRDLDNLLKATLDALEAGKVYISDNQVDQLMVRRLQPKKPGGLKVIIEQLIG